VEGKEAALIQHALISMSNTIALGQNYKLVESYDRIGVPEEETAELLQDLSHNESVKKLPTLVLLNIPLVPLLLKKRMGEVYKLAHILDDQGMVSSFFIVLADMSMSSGVSNHSESTVNRRLQTSQSH